MRRRLVQMKEMAHEFIPTLAKIIDRHWESDWLVYFTTKRKQRTAPYYIQELWGQHLG